MVETSYSQHCPTTALFSYVLHSRIIYHKIIIIYHYVVVIAHPAALHNHVACVATDKDHRSRNILLLFPLLHVCTTNIRLCCTKHAVHTVHAHNTKYVYKYRHTCSIHMHAYLVQRRRVGHTVALLLASVVPTPQDTPTMFPTGVSPCLRAFHLRCLSRRQGQPHMTTENAYDITTAHSQCQS